LKYDKNHSKMADSDDWENDLENDETDDTKKKTFEDEDKNVKT